MKQNINILTASIIRVITLMMETVSSSEMPVNNYQTTRRYIPEDLCKYNASLDEADR
jgi:hypothetical protein